jgi:uncharacterized protein YjbI with pentapeptide repeats
MNFKEVDLSGANLQGANLVGALLDEAILLGANLSGADLKRTDLSRAKLGRANLSQADLGWASLKDADLSETQLYGANLFAADLRGAKLDGARLGDAVLAGANLTGAILCGAELSGANLGMANLYGANLAGARLEYAQLSGANLMNADLTGCRVHGISSWGVKLDESTKQRGLVITVSEEPEVTVDNIEVAQFIYLLLHNAKIRDVIDTIGRKAVLLLGRFTEGRIVVLERLRVELRQRGYLPIVFNFDKPETKDFTETIRLLAGLSHFVIADVTNPKSAPLELQATVPEIMVPFLPIIEEGQQPFAMLQDLWVKHRDWVFEPLHYASLDALVRALDKEIIEPAEVKFDELVVKKAETMKGRHVS